MKGYPAYNAAPPFYSVPALLLRHGVTAEEFGLVEPEKITADSILARVASDPDVMHATAMWDLATPSTHYALARARDEAQARLGIAETDRHYLYTGQIDGEFIPIVSLLGRETKRLRLKP